MRDAFNIPKFTNAAEAGDLLCNESGVIEGATFTNFSDRAPDGDATALTCDLNSCIR